VLEPPVAPSVETDSEGQASYDTQPFYAPWAFKEVGPGNWHIRDETEVLPFTYDPSWSKERRKSRLKLWAQHHTCYAYFVRMMRRNYGRERADRILRYLWERYREHLQMAEPGVEPRPPRLWDFEQDREMSPAHKVLLWIKLRGMGTEAAAGLPEE
jgi:hypothetical protein